jgi:Tlde1 domain
MTGTALPFHVASTFERPVSTRGKFPRIIARGVAIGLGTMAAAGLLAAVAIVAAFWLVSTVLPANSSLHERTPFGPSIIALANYDPASSQDIWLARAPTAPGPIPDLTGKDKLAVTTASVSAPASVAPTMRQPSAEKPPTAAVDAPDRQAKTAPATIPASTHVASLAPAAVPGPEITGSLPPARSVELADVVPLPLPRPVARGIVTPPAGERAPRVAALTPSSHAPVPETRVTPQRPDGDLKSLPAPKSRTAVYDIAAHTVYMPNGEKLVAHSGLGGHMDDPRYIRLRNRGPTPPNVYQLSLREKLFHGVRAIRMTPVDDGKMFGRDGMLAHSYMLGPSGQSNGCVSFQNYRAFLQAFLNGEVERLVVVPRLGAEPARALRAHRSRGDRVAANVF